MGLVQVMDVLGLTDCVGGTVALDAPVLGALPSPQLGHLLRRVAQARGVVGSGAVVCGNTGARNEMRR